MRRTLADRVLGLGEGKERHCGHQRVRASSDAVRAFRRGGPEGSEDRSRCRRACPHDRSKWREARPKAEAPLDVRGTACFPYRARAYVYLGCQRYA